MKADSGNFFDQNSTFYGPSTTYSHDYYLINFIKQASKNRQLDLLDIGGGGGTFSKVVITECPNVDVTVLDVSKEMLNKIQDGQIKKVVGKLPDQILLNSSFDYIHIKEVLHHVTGDSIAESRILLIKSLQNVKNLLDEDGLLFIHEIFYESPIVPTMSSRLIYYLCMIQNKLRIKIPVKDFLLDLDVYFYNRDEFRLILDECGYEIIDYYEEKWVNTFKERLILIRNRGRMVFVCRKVK